MQFENLNTSIQSINFDNTQSINFDFDQDESAAPLLGTITMIGLTALTLLGTIGACYVWKQFRLSSQPENDTSIPIAQNVWLPPLLSKASLETIEQYLNDWVLEGSPDELRQTAKERIMVFLSNENKRSLELNNLELSSLPEIFNLKSFSKRLTWFDASDNKLTSFPSTIGNLTVLNHLYLRDNQIATIPPEIGNLTVLDQLYLRDNQIATIPPEIGNLTDLRILELRDNQIATIPPEIGNLTALIELSFCGNQIATIPPEIGNLTALIELSFRDNQIATIPPEIGNLTDLRTLEFAYNQLVTLPPEIGNLSEITRLDLVNNSITGFPLEIMSLLNTCTISINNNSLTPHILRSLRQRADAENYAGPRFSFSMWEIDNLQFDQNKSTAELLQDLYAEIEQEYIPFANIPGQHISQESLQSWLLRLSFMKDYSSSPERKRWLIENIIKYLKFADENESYCAQFGAIITDAGTSCGDRVALSILRLGIAYCLEMADRSDMTAFAHFLARNVWAMSMLEQIAREKVETLPFFDEIEVYLAYPLMLKHRLKLSLDVQDMLYYRVSGVTTKDLDDAYQFVSDKLGDTAAFHKFLVKEKKWTDLLEVNYADKYAAIVQARDDQSNMDNADYVRIEEEYHQALLQLTSTALNGAASS